MIKWSKFLSLIDCKTIYEKHDFENQIMMDINLNEYMIKVEDKEHSIINYYKDIYGYEI